MKIEKYPSPLPLYRTEWYLRWIFGPWWFYNKDMTRHYLSYKEYNRLFNKEIL